MLAQTVDSGKKGRPIFRWNEEVDEDATMFRIRDWWIVSRVISGKGSLRMPGLGDELWNR